MRVASRRRGTYWVRFFAAALAIGAVALILLSARNLRSQDQSQILFVTLSVIAFIYCVLAGILTTADCVSEERREGTLGLLFLTNLRGYDVVAGKLAASSARAVSALAALFPVIALPVLMGGVSGDVVWTVAAVLGNTLFFSLGVGVLVSTLTRDARQSIGGAVGVMLFWLGLLPLIRILWIEYLIRPKFAGTPAELEQMFRWVLEVNPVFVFANALSPIFRGTPVWRDVWLGLMYQHGLAWLALITACVVLPRSWRDRVETVRLAKDGGDAGAGSGSGSAASGARRWRSELLDWDPMAWVVVRERRSAVVNWLGLAVVAGVWFWGYWEVKEEWLAGLVGLWTTFAAALWLKLRLAAIACRHLQEHRRSGALELVLSTPMTPATMVRGVLRGMRHMLFPALATVLAAAGLLLAASLGQEQAWSDRREVPMTFVVGLGVFLLDLVAIAWSGMWRGLNSTRYIRAYSMTVGMILVVPWGLFILSLIVLGILSEALSFSGSLDFGFLTLLVWWAMISVAVDVWQILAARRGLRERFLELASEPSGTIRVAGRAEEAASGAGGVGKPL